jgi:hypothetical protein
VYRATRAEGFEPVAVRVLPAGAWRVVERDLEAVVGRRHSAALDIVELITVGEITHVVMDFADGGTWSDLIIRRGSSPSVSELIVVGERTAAALAELHGLGVLHQALRAHNVLVADGEFDVSDLGVGALHGQPGGRPRADVRTIQDLAPEVMRGGPATAASDVYQLAAMLAYQRRASSTRLSDPRSAEASAELDRLLDACLEPNPARRPGASEVRDWFVAIASSLGVAPAVSRPPPVAPDRPSPTPLAERAAPARPVPTERPAPTSEPPRRRDPLPRRVAADPIALIEPEPARPRRMRVGLAAASIIGAGTLAIGALVITRSGSGDGERPALAAPEFSAPGASAPNGPATTPAVTAPTITSTGAAPVIPSSAPGAVTPANPVTPPASTVDDDSARPVVRSVSVSAVRDGSTDACGTPTSYQPELATDGSNDTAWMVPGDGSGQSITMHLAGPSTVRSVGLVPGYDKFDPCLGTERFEQFRRITSVRWTFDDGTSIDQVIDPVPAMASLRLPTPQVTSSVQMTVLDTTAPGDERLDHTAVSEIAIR